MMTLRRIPLVLAFGLCSSLLAALAAQAPQPAPFSPLLIRGGQVIDGTGTPAVRVDVRTSGDVIVEIGAGLQPREGDRVIDATGKVVAPGFIDIHTHVDRGITSDPGAESQLRQGLTTIVGGNCGGSELPVADFLESVDETHTALNIATLVGHGTVRGLVMGGDYRRPATPAEIETMKVLVDRAMRDGAVGLSSGLEYDPGRYAKPEEVVALASVVTRHGGYYASHVRDEEREVFSAWREAIDVGRKTGVPVEISHIKLAVKPMWGKAAEGLRILEDARREGIRVMADWYPYTYWHSSIYVVISDPNLENRSAWEEGLADIGGAESLLVTSYRPDPSLEFKTVAEIARMWRKDAVTTVVEMIRAAGPGIGVNGTSMDEADLATFLAHPQVLIGSDGSLGGSHTRSYNAFPRVLARYVREKHVIPLPEAIAKMTGRPAAQIGLTDRGVLAPGKKADLVVLDPAAIEDRGTPQD
ncbi:MAG: D-aminoacylase, partial [Acidobacteria bacterium]|nr:D-aminoacylase [Acidobacteriota bacterium]